LYSFDPLEVGEAKMMAFSMASEVKEVKTPVCQA
jgi:hypothetical protein